MTTPHTQQTPNIIHPLVDQIHAVHPQRHPLGPRAPGGPARGGQAVPRAAATGQKPHTRLQPVRAADQALRCALMLSNGHMMGRLTSREHGHGHHQPEITTTTSKLMAVELEQFRHVNTTTPTPLGVQLEQFKHELHNMIMLFVWSLLFDWTPTTSLTLPLTIVLKRHFPRTFPQPPPWYHRTVFVAHMLRNASD